MFDKILIANRGEIACRVIRTARRMGIRTVAVYSDADARALHARSADESVHIGGAASRDSYLKIPAIIDAARRTGAQAIHPGYGFLSENEDFARACADAGIVFIGPPPEAIEAMGLKDRAKTIMDRAGVPVVPGYQGKTQDAAHLLLESRKIGFPVLIKAVAGGGGKGMRLVEREQDFAAALESCKREAKASFGNEHVLIEKYIVRPRHVEVQVFGDNHGNAVYLFERDCSLQRRHQKVVEEAPAPGMTDKMRREMGEAAVKAAKAIKYSGAGTIEFIADAALKNFYFMEMNTRLQVEHPVTEMITGLDLVEWQIRVAAGEKLPLAQKDLKINGHAFEVRLYAEDPAAGFLPQTGQIESFMQPPDARLDTGVTEGDSISIHYDPMIAKLITHGRDREEALHKMATALAGTGVAGLRTNQEFLYNIFKHSAFAAAELDTGFIARHEKDLVPSFYGRPRREEMALAAVWFLSGLNSPSSFRTSGVAARSGIHGAIDDGVGMDPGFRRGDRELYDIWEVRDNWRLNGVLQKSLTILCRDEPVTLTALCEGRRFEVVAGAEKFTAEFIDLSADHLTITVNGQRLSAAVAGQGRDLTIFHCGRAVALHLYVHGSADDDAGGEGRITAPMPGKIVNVMVCRGDDVEKDQPLLVMEAMKMEMTIRAGCAGVIDELPVAVNDQVQDGALLVSIRAPDKAA